MTSDLPYSQWSTRRKYLLEKRVEEELRGALHEREEAERHMIRIAKLPEKAAGDRLVKGVS